MHASSHCVTEDSFQSLMQRKLLSSYDVESEESKPGGADKSIHEESEKAPSRYANLNQSLHLIFVLSYLHKLMTASKHSRAKGN